MEAKGHYCVILLEPITSRHEWGIPCLTRGWGFWSIFLRSVIFLNFHHCQNTQPLLNIMFIFGRCCRSSDAVTPVKYKCDSKNLTGTSARLKILLTEKLTNGALVTPTPGACDCLCLMQEWGYLCLLWVLWNPFKVFASVRHSAFLLDFMGNILNESIRRKRKRQIL